MMRVRSFFPENRNREDGSLFPVVIATVASLSRGLTITSKRKTEKNSGWHILHLENRTYQNVSGFNSRKILNRTNSLMNQSMISRREKQGKAETDGLYQQLRPLD